MLPQHLDFIFDISGALDAPALASMWLYDSVSWLSCFRAVDISRLRFHSSSSTRRIRERDGIPGVLSGCHRWPRYILDASSVPFLLMRFLCSQRPPLNSFRVAVCAARCAILPASSPTYSVAFAIAPALQIALNVSRRLRLAHMASWLDFSTQRDRFDFAVVPAAAGTHPIVFGAVDNLSAVPNALDTSQFGLLVQVTSWPSNLT